MRTIWKYVIVAALGIILGVASTLSLKKCPKITETVIHETDTTITDNVDSTGVVIVTPENVSVVPVTIKTIHPHPVTNPTGDVLETPVNVDTNKWTGKTELNNGTIDWTIYADSLYGTDFKLTTKDTVIRETTTITQQLPTRSRLFLMGGAELGINKTLHAASVGLMYNRRQRWGAGVEVRHDLTGVLPPNLRTTVGAKVYIGL